MAGESRNEMRRFSEQLYNKNRENRTWQEVSWLKYRVRQSSNSAQCGVRNAVLCFQTRCPASKAGEGRQKNGTGSGAGMGGATPGIPATGGLPNPQRDVLVVGRRFEAAWLATRCRGEFKHKAKQQREGETHTTQRQRSRTNACPAQPAANARLPQHAPPSRRRYTPAQPELSRVLASKTAASTAAAIARSWVDPYACARR